jgi:hypothetical protein
MAGLFISPFAPAFALNGIIAPAATLTFYATGTSTPANVYADAGLVTSLGSVVTANAQGQFVAIYLSPTQVYRVVLKTSAGVVLGDIDPVTESTLAQLGGSSGASLVGFLQAGASAVATTLQVKNRKTIHVTDDGAVGSGTVDDYAAVNSALTDYAGTRINVPFGSFRTDTPLTPLADTQIIGGGQMSEFKRVSGDNHVFNLNAAGTTLQGIKITGVASGVDALSNVGARVTATTNVTVNGVKITGMVGSGILSTGGSSFGRFFNLYVTARSGTIANASDVMLYTSTTQNITAFSRLEGGGHTGIYQQIDSSRNKNLFNYIGSQHGYGILDYQPANNAASLNLNLGNSIDGVAGDQAYGLDLRFGAGIYSAGTGMNMSGFNFITNCNTSTANQTLVPAGIGHNMTGTPFPIMDVSNCIFANAWFGYQVVQATAPVGCIANIVRENLNDQITYLNSDHPVVIGNIVDTITATLSFRGIGINPGAGSYHRGALVNCNKIRGTGGRAVDIFQTRSTTMVGNSISDIPATKVSCWLQGDDYLVWTGNNVDGSGSDNYTLRVIDCSYSTFGSSIIQGGVGATIIIQIDGTCTNSFFDKSIILVGKPEPMNFINNQSAACIVEMFGSGPPTLNNHQVGDRVHSRSRAVGSPKAWSCTVAGAPGTWQSEGNL